MHNSSSEVMLSCYYFKVTDLSDGSISYASDKKKIHYKTIFRYCSVINIILVLKANYLP